MLQLKTRCRWLRLQALVLRVSGESRKLENAILAPVFLFCYAFVVK